MYAISALMAIRTKTGNYQRSDAESRYEIRIRNQRDIYLVEILSNYLKNK